MIDLHQRGRVLPESWNHCFINGSGNLEVYQVGEVNEEQLLQHQWYVNLYRDQIRSLKQQLSKVKERERLLEGFLDEARYKLGQTPAAND